MSDRTRVALGLAGGYVLGRYRKTRWVVALAALAVTSRVVQRGTAALDSSPELKQLANQTRETAVAVAGSRIQGLTELIHSKSESLREQLQLPVPNGQPAEQPAEHQEGPAQQQQAEAEQPQEAVPPAPASGQQQEEQQAEQPEATPDQPTEESQEEESGQQTTKQAQGNGEKQHKEESGEEKQPTVKDDEEEQRQAKEDGERRTQVTGRPTATRERR